MFKKCLLVLFLLCLFISQPLFAQTAPTETEQDTSNTTNDKEEPWYSFFTKLFGQDSSDGSQVKTGANWNYAKEKPDNGDGQSRQLLDTSENSEYNSQGFDTTTRAISYSSQKIAKGKYLYHLLKNDDSYENIKYQSTGCNQISLKEMAAAYYHRGEKILYDENNQLIDWDKSIMDNITLNYSDANDPCYTTVYDQIPMVPQGTFHEKSLIEKITGSDSKIAAASSKQINNTFKTTIPDSRQGDDVPDNIDDPDQTSKVVENSHTQEGNLLLSMIPDSGQYLSTDPNNSDDRDNLRIVYAHWLHPDSWDDDSLPERDENSQVDGTVIGCGFGIGVNSSTDPTATSSATPTSAVCTIDNSNSSSTGSCNAKGSHCRGMSQYGAYGMALSGKNYLDILKFYYGNIALGNIGTNNTIKVKNSDSNSGCSGSQLALNLEEYLYGLGEMSDYWGKKGFEALKAQAVAARTYAYVRTKGLKESICNSSKCQVFKCNNLSKKPLFQKAVDATAGQVIIDATAFTMFSTEYARSFCGPSKEVTFKNHTNPSVNGINYEQKALISTGKSSTAFCK